MIEKNKNILFLLKYKMWCFTYLFHFYCIQSKQIISNTLLKRDSVELYDTNINLTIWL